MIKHRYGDRYLHNGALEIGFRKLDLSENLFLIGHFIFAFCFLICALLILLLDVQEKLKERESLKSFAKASLLTPPYLWDKWPPKLSPCKATQPM
ncbi:hypothetical protein T4A_8493 [Trichinella pseudospiralis]|uniref:Uncharacterized protein n=1 Tax=Trichinella pseudospiralis TaxID=6337 RepID=A0A0V1EJU4_TRIPS|nr:hypothetical protein T4A_8493 [Trichinella pseudospiralis]